MSEKIELLGLSREEIENEVAKLGEKSFRAKQLWQWIYNKGIKDFSEMSNLSKDFREKLSQNYSITRPKVITEQVSVDKTHKWLLEFSDGQRVEMVYIPEEESVILLLDIAIPSPSEIIFKALKVFSMLCNGSPIPITTILERYLVSSEGVGHSL